LPAGTRAYRKLHKALPGVDLHYASPLPHPAVVETIVELAVVRRPPAKPSS
jgi:hypothetical protein